MKDAVQELDALAADARAADTAAELHGEGAARGAEQPAAAPGLTPAQEWAQVPAIFGRIVGRFYPEVNAIYSEKACDAWGASMVPVAERYGWTASKFFAWLGPWIGLAMATEALATPTYQVLAARVRSAREEAAKAAESSTAAQQ